MRRKNTRERGGIGESDARFPNRCVRLKLLRLWFPFPGAEHSFSRLNWTRAKLKVHSWQQAGKEEMQQNTCVEERCLFYFAGLVGARASQFFHGVRTWVGSKVSFPPTLCGELDFVLLHCSPPPSLASIHLVKSTGRPESTLLSPPIFLPRPPPGGGGRGQTYPPLNKRRRR